MNIGKFLTLERFCESEKAKLKGIDNIASDPTHIENAKAWCVNIFDPICEHFGTVPYLSSGFRSRALNMITKGASLTSDHNVGRAGDIDQDGRGLPTNRQIYDFVLMNLKFDQLIWEFGDDVNPSWVHIGFRLNANRMQTLRATPNPANSQLTKYLSWRPT